MVWDICLASHPVVWYGISDFSPIPFLIRDMAIDGSIATDRS